MYSKKKNTHDYGPRPGGIPTFANVVVVDLVVVVVVVAIVVVGIVVVGFGVVVVAIVVVIVVALVVVVVVVVVVGTGSLRPTSIMMRNKELSKSGPRPPPNIIIFNKFELLFPFIPPLSNIHGNADDLSI